MKICLLSNKPENNNEDNSYQLVMCHLWSLKDSGGDGLTIIEYNLATLRIVSNIYEPKFPGKKILLLYKWLGEYGT